MAKSLKVKWSQRCVNEEDVLDAVNNIDIFKPSAIDNFSAIVLKDAFLVLVQELTFMYNLSFSTAIVRKKWKTAKITPIRKQGDHTNVNNSRPIALHPLPGKIEERLFHTQPPEYLEHNNLFYHGWGGQSHESHRKRIGRLCPGPGQSLSTICPA